MQPLQIRRFSRDGPNPTNRRTFPGAPNGVWQSLQRGSDGIARLTRRTHGFQQKCPLVSPSRTQRHSSSCVSLCLATAEWIIGRRGTHPLERRTELGARTRAGAEGRGSDSHPARSELELLDANRPVYEPRTSTARAVTSTMSTSETTDSTDTSSFALAVSGNASVGLNAVPLVSETKR